jgi:hypothetical protein
LQNGNELLRNETGEGSYKQPLIAYVGEEKISLDVTVEERRLSQEEAQREVREAKIRLSEILKGKNDSLDKITTSLEFADAIPESTVEVDWVLKPSEYFYSDGRLRENTVISEPVELRVAAVLSCQEYAEDYEEIITLIPKVPTMQENLLEAIKDYDENHSGEESMLLPQQYQDELISWRKPMDVTFLYLLFLTVSALIFLKFGAKRDEQQKKKERMEMLEKDYAQIVSKFTMLLSAGLSVRNAWERIVFMQKRKGMPEKVIDEELRWGLREMQKGVPELYVYECFGQRVGEIHYKKLMAIFVSHKRRGGTELLELMNEEMLLAWEEKKRKARQQGEKIGTKLLIPMMGMLSVVFIMILVPAFLSFQI